MDDVDFYRLLGVSPTADPAEIDTAYRMMVRQCHPDTGAADPGLLDRLKRVNQAYEVLSDLQKRQTYDRQLARRRSSGWSQSAALRTRPERRRADFTNRGTVGSGPSFGADDIERELPVSPEEARQGGPCELRLTIPERCAGCGGTVGSATLSCAMCQGSGTVHRSRQFTILLPGGLRTGSILRMPGYGRQRLGGCHGDLVLRVKVCPSW